MKSHNGVAHRDSTILRKTSIGIAIASFNKNLNWRVSTKVMKKDYQLTSSQEITTIFEALKNNNKCEQYNFEVKKSGNSVDAGQICGMLNSEGGLIIVGVEEKVPTGSGYTFHPISNLQTENGKIKTQIDKLKRDNLDVANIIETCCIIESFSYDGQVYPIIKVNPSDAVFVFDGRIYCKQREDKDYLKTRNDIVAYIGKAGDYSTFVHKINSSKLKLLAISTCVGTVSRDTVKCVYLSSSDIGDVKELIEAKSGYIQTKINVATLTENLIELQAAIQYLEQTTPFCSFVAPALDETMRELGWKKNAVTVLSEIIAALDKISADH